MLMMLAGLRLVVEGWTADADDARVLWWTVGQLMLL